MQADGSEQPLQYAEPGQDLLGLISVLGYRSVAAVIGHDHGSPVAAWCSVVRPDVFRSVVMMSAPFAGPQALPFDSADAAPAEPPIDHIYEELAALKPPRKYYMKYYATREAQQHVARSAGSACLFARLLPHEERRLEAKYPVSP